MHRTGYMVTTTWPSLGPLNQYATIIIIITSVLIIINTGATCPATTMTHTLYLCKIPVLSTQPLHRESQILAQLTMLPTWPPHGHKTIQHTASHEVTFTKRALDPPSLHLAAQIHIQ